MRKEIRFDISHISFITYRVRAVYIYIYIHGFTQALAKAGKSQNQRLLMTLIATTDIEMDNACLYSCLLSVEGTDTLLRDGGVVVMAFEMIALFCSFYLVVCVCVFFFWGGVLFFFAPACFSC